MTPDRVSIADPTSARRRSSEPSAERDISVWLVIAIFVWIETTVDSFAWTFLGPEAIKWTATRDASEALIQGIPQNVVEIGMTLAIAAWLGWLDGLGFRTPKRGPTGLFLAVFLLLPGATFAAMGAWRVSGDGVGWGLMAAALVYYTIQPASEEILFRGFLLHGISRRLGTYLGVLLSSGLFALAHVVPWGWPPTVRSFSLLFGFGVLACGLRIVTGSIWVPIAFHGFYNLMWTTYGWIDRPVGEYATLWYWARTIRVLGVLAMVSWLFVIILVAVLTALERWTAGLGASADPPGGIRRS
jgi:membrane protease YdiL (CAAX protease family)